MTWATISDTTALTGVTVDESTLAQAQRVVELFAGITEDNTTTLSGGNARMLRAAVAYQAAWMKAQIDVLSRVDVASLTQDGASVTPAGRDDLVLAPLAKRALARLSWHGRRSTSLRACAPTFATLEAYRAAWMRDETGDAWAPLGVR